MLRATLCVFSTLILSVLVYGSTKFEIVIDNVNFAVFDYDLSEPGDSYRQIKFGDKLTEQFKLDKHYKLKLKFSVKDKTKNIPLYVHQAFVALTHADTQREVIFLAERVETDSKSYVLDLNLKAQEKVFAGVSGKYALRLILGDTSASNSVDWHLADLEIEVAAFNVPQVPKSKRINYSPLPTIQHKFSQPEPRPARIVSDAFALVCIVPLLLLFIMWIRIGVNFKNASFSLWALGFHVGLAAIFGLYFLYWLHLNMFQTLQYLGWIGFFTFICGNRFLHNFHKSKKQKAE